MDFKIGDKVKTGKMFGTNRDGTKKWRYGGSMPQGVAGVIKDINSSAIFVTSENFDDFGKDNGYNFHPDELDLVPNETKTSEAIPFLKSLDEAQKFLKENDDLIKKIDTRLHESENKLFQHGLTNDGFSTDFRRLNEIVANNATEVNERLTKLEGNKNVTDGILKAHRDQFSIIMTRLESNQKPPTTSIFDNLNSPEEAVSFLVSEWVKCTNMKVKNKSSDTESSFRDDYIYFHIGFRKHS